MPSPHSYFRIIAPCYQAFVDFCRIHRLDRNLTRYVHHRDHFRGLAFGTVFYVLPRAVIDDEARHVIQARRFQVVHVQASVADGTDAFKPVEP